ncbi:unnamed protein product [Blepharisma stoltei]|uniref:FYVE-type domain-containing protein n=1 Tax=Blepharisma stoltei TaxID=1481888 RepID=A0AAU9IU80_9CILI|nr:unnamed protein product [Blepharisma stoltei]
MGNSQIKEEKETSEVKDQVFESQFKRIIYTPNNFNNDPKNTEWNNVLLKIEGGVLYSFMDSRLEHKVKINKAISISAEDAHLKEFLLGLQLSGEDFIWRLRSETLVEFIQWKKALMICRRPEWQKSNVCQECGAAFHVYRRSHHCRSCGRQLCDKCSSYFMDLESMGYITQQRSCKKCISEWKMIRNSTTGSMIEERKRISRSIMKQKMSLLNATKDSFLEKDLKESSNPSLLCGMGKDGF